MHKLQKFHTPNGVRPHRNARLLHTNRYFQRKRDSMEKSFKNKHIARVEYAHITHSDFVGILMDSKSVFHTQIWTLNSWWGQMPKPQLSGWIQRQQTKRLRHRAPDTKESIVVVLCLHPRWSDDQTGSSETGNLNDVQADNTPARGMWKGICQDYLKRSL